MRAKSETKRQAILDVATEVFREVGFERASMSEICARVGGSKATIYNYFPSKEELFFEIMFRSTEKEFEATHEALDPFTDDIAESLCHFGERLLALLFSPEVQAARRLIVSEAGRGELGRLCFERGPQRSLAMVSDFLQAAMDLGKLRQADAQVATLHLRGLLEAELLDHFLFQVPVEVSEEKIRGIVVRAVTVFIAAYGPV
ncbi:TetR/AcrR family transcriptional regulator [Propionivibrio limicola]|uniref:TetR/AcrR family transcriptional regulator n=1 Tax=Propionivibrio limicola TaxID=167645 RepID=UPI001291E236|nr:TetR/AcrR family transcriptional regulator [Propionivibrio limicola]